MPGLARAVARLAGHLSKLDSFHQLPNQHRDAGFALRLPRLATADHADAPENLDLQLGKCSSSSARCGVTRSKAWKLGLPLLEEGALVLIRRYAATAAPQLNRSLAKELCIFGS